MFHGKHAYMQPASVDTMPRGEPTKKQLEAQLEALKTQVKELQAKDLVMLSARVPRVLRDELTDIARADQISLQQLVQDVLDAYASSRREN